MEYREDDFDIYWKMDSARSGDGSPAGALFFLVISIIIGIPIGFTFGRMWAILCGVIIFMIGIILSIRGGE